MDRSRKAALIRSGGGWFRIAVRVREKRLGRAGIDEPGDRPDPMDLIQRQSSFAMGAFGHQATYDPLALTTTGAAADFTGVIKQSITAVVTSGGNSGVETRHGLALRWS